MQITDCVSVILRFTAVITVKDILCLPKKRKKEKSTILVNVISKEASDLLDRLETSNRDYAPYLCF